MSKYTKKYFIKKLNAIPDKNWITDYNLFDKKNPERGCLLYHLGVKNYDYTPTKEALALVEIIYTNLSKLAKTISICSKIEQKFDKLKEGEDNNLWIVSLINDSAPIYKLTPKQAILNCLEAIKK